MFLVVVTVIIKSIIILCAAHPDENLTITQCIRKYSYPVEVHDIETPDGHVLTLYRIRHGRSNRESKEVALLVQDTWTFLGPTDALAFYLADRGYDVWLFNARGTAHSRKHRSLNANIDRKRFWDFSWHEIGIIDIPTSINYILLKTGKDKIFYIGHSQGATSLFVMLSEWPEMNEKIKVAVLLAAVVKLHLTPFVAFTVIAKFMPLLKRLLEMFNWHELAMPNSPMINRIIKSLCRGEFMSDICLDIINIIGGTKSGYFNKTLLPVVLESFPSGMAVRQVWHYAQLILSGDFTQYDFGKKQNLKLYNSTQPPHYDLANTRIPLGIFYAVGDHFATEEMTIELVKELSNVVLLHKIKHGAFNHFDYIVACNAREVVYEPLYKLFQEYEDNNM